MTREEKLETLMQWQEFAGRIKALLNSIKLLFNSSDSPIHREYWRLYTDYTALIAQLVGDRNEWLEWYAWENEFGAKSLVAGIDKNTFKVRNIADLLNIIEQHNAAKGAAA